MSRRGFGNDSSELDVSAVLRRDIPWDTYLTARLIDDKELQLLKRYDKASKETKVQLLKEAGEAHVEAFVGVLQNVTKEDVVQYVLASLDEMLSEDSSRAKLFHTQEKKHDIYGIFLRLLQRSDWFTQEKSCRLLTAVLRSRPKDDTAISSNGHSQASSSQSPSAGSIDSTLNTFVNWLCGQLRRPSNTWRSVLVAVSALSQILKGRSVRNLLLRSGGVPLLGPLLKTSGGTTTPFQLLYEAALCIWQLSFLPEAAEEIASSRDIVTNLVEIVRTAHKEKVVRIALSALKNLLLAPGIDAGPSMVEAGLQKVVTQRQMQNWEDEDIPALLEVVKENLAQSIQQLSSFEKYKREVTSGNLDWGPMHTSNDFWRENVGKLEEKDFTMLRSLLKLIEKSRDPKILAVGCNDVGYFISFHPQGRQVVQDLRGKEMVMRLMMHPDAHVQKQALLCVQKIMLTRDKLDFLQAQSQD